MSEKKTKSWVKLVGFSLSYELHKSNFIQKYPFHFLKSLFTIFLVTQLHYFYFKNSIPLNEKIDLTCILYVLYVYLYKKKELV